MDDIVPPVPNVLADIDIIDNIWLNKASIQLFGHTHEPNDRVTDEKCYRVTGGSLYPPADDHTTPYYNYLTLKVDDSGEARRLAVTLSERRWEKRSLKFVERSFVNEAFPCPVGERRKWK